MASIFDFPPFRLDLRAGRLSRDGAPVPLRPKTYAVLAYLLAHHGALITKEALLDAVWGETAVTDDVVRISVRELRSALGDERLIETVPRRGYRFTADVVTEGAWLPPTAAIVGRLHERADVLRAFDAAASGRRQVVFVSGEAGIGKTTLVDAVLRELRGRPVRVTEGQCVEHYGSGEPYLPVLEAIDGLRRGPLGPPAEATLREHAPAWLLRAIGIQSSPDEDSPAPEHTLHALAASLEVLAAETPLVLVLEDVHWIDYSTLDLLAVLAQRRRPARLLVLCTLRPADAIARGHPVTQMKRELLRKGSCRELALSGLSGTDVASYLAARFPGCETGGDLLPLLMDRSEGNPFAIVTLLDHLVDRQLLVERGGRWEVRKGVETLRTVIPDGLRAVVEPRLERLADDELELLEVACVAGSGFSADVIARVAPRLADVEHVHGLCDALVRRQEILRLKDERYEFRHALYQQVIYQRLPAARRRRLHQAVGEALEALQSGRTSGIAATLAVHFERSGDVQRAVRHRGEAATHARSRFAYQETRLHLEAALALLTTQEESAERLGREVALLQELGVTLFAIKGYGHEDGARVFARMRDLARRMDGGAAHFQAMEGQLVVHTMRGEFIAARALGAEVIALAEQRGHSTATANAHVVHSATLYLMAECDAARSHAERGHALLDPDAPPLPADVGVTACVMLATTHLYAGHLARARAFNREAVARAGALGTPFHRALANSLAAEVCMLLDDVSEARSLADEAIRLADEYDFSALRITTTMTRGWCDVEQGHVGKGLAALRGAFQAYGATGQRYGLPSYTMLLARAYVASGDAAAALDVVDGALRFAATTGGRVYEPEFHRLKGECLVLHARPEQAARSFERAMTIAAERKALLFELRAATGRCRLGGAPARTRLAAIVARFDPAEDGTNLRAAHALLDVRSA